MFGKTRRSGILIEPYKQLRFGLMYLFVNLVFASLIFGVFGHFLWDMYSAMATYFKLDEAQSMIASAKFIEPVVICSTLGLIFIIVTLTLSARYTHQFYGPLISINRFLDELNAGKTPVPIKLRANDQLQELADRLNKMSDSLAQDRISDKSRDALLHYVDAMVDGKHPIPLELAPSDPLASLARKLNELNRRN